MKDFDVLSYAIQAIDTEAKAKGLSLTVIADDGADWAVESMPMAVVFPVSSQLEDESGDLTQETRSFDFGVSIAVASPSIQDIAPYVAAARVLLQDRYMDGLTESLTHTKTLYDRGGGVTPFVQAELLFSSKYIQEV